MIPSLDKPKYKPLIRLRTNIWNTLQKKKLKKKKWIFLISIIKRQTKRFRGKIPKVRNYYKKEVLRFPVYARYRYQRNLVLRINIRLIYGRLQNYKIKQIALRSKKNSWISYIQKLEQTVGSFLYRANLIITYGEAQIHHKHKRIYVCGNPKEIYLKKGDTLHFRPDFEGLLRRRLMQHYLLKTSSLFNKSLKNFNRRKKKKKKKFYYGIQTCVDFDTNSFRFFFLSNIKYFKNHPFKVPFEKVMRWYTKV